MRSRPRGMSLGRALLRRHGDRLRRGAPESLRRRVDELELPDTLQAEVLPLLTAMQSVNEQFATLEQTSATMAQADAVGARWRSAPGVGPLTALAFVTTREEVERFDHAHPVERYLGLLPREWRSGEPQRGKMTQQGRGRRRALVVGAAWRILRPKGAAGGKLRRWAERIAARRGTRVAVVALARRRAGILYALWRDGRVYEAARVGPLPRAVAAGAYRVHGPQEHTPRWAVGVSSPGAVSAGSSLAAVTAGV